MGFEGNYLGFRTKKNIPASSFKSRRLISAKSLDDVAAAVEPRGSASNHLPRSSSKKKRKEKKKAVWVTAAPSRPLAAEKSLRPDSGRKTCVCAQLLNSSRVKILVFGRARTRKSITVITVNVSHSTVEFIEASSAWTTCAGQEGHQSRIIVRPPILFYFYFLREGNSSSKVPLLQPGVWRTEGEILLLPNQEVRWTVDVEVSYILKSHGNRGGGLGFLHLSQQRARRSLLRKSFSFKK